MPSQHSKGTTPVTVRRPTAEVHAARSALGERGDTMTALVGYALREYTAGRLTLPPADDPR